ncbi:hypothetical protein [Azospirillum thermophilum]|uniref:Lipoprotein n=1 Tax=Azospirillum thermophilum TaxID=2202148 RepID=A0A2S2CV20_9PROT|nr:hypothetical protein [Azospirillum thermophilum]AWK88220.1 hypothetical protein DEW08_19105 [Azospirillum thermophilum]
MPKRTPAAVAAPLAALLTATLAVAGCMMSSPAPDTEYRQALEKAIEAGRCEGPQVQAMWAAYHRWYAVSTSIGYYHPNSEAEALLRQGEMFRILGCANVARATYEMLLQRFPGPNFEFERDFASRALASLPPPVLPPVPQGGAGGVTAPTGSAVPPAPRPVVTPLTAPGRPRST